jgi:hypothetical protein
MSETPDFESQVAAFKAAVAADPAMAAEMAKITRGMLWPYQVAEIIKARNITIEETRHGTWAVEPDGTRWPFKALIQVIYEDAVMGALKELSK